MTIWEAITVVLEDTRGPLHPKEIFEKIVRNNLYRFNAKNPVHVVTSAIRRRCENLAFPTASKEKYFIRLPDGRYALNSYSTPGIKDSGILQQESDCAQLEIQLNELHIKYKNAFKRLLLEELKRCTPTEFEYFSMNFLKAYGFSELRVTQQSRDDGIDGFATLNIGISKMHVAFQCKRWTKGKVGPDSVNEFIGSISGKQKHGKFVDQGFFFTTSSFTKAAAKAAEREGKIPTILVDGEHYVSCMLEKGFGVTTSAMLPLYTASVDSQFSDEA